MARNQQFSLRWNNYLTHITDAFQTLREDENLVDVTLCCEGRKIKAHKMLLSACSSYFREIFKDNPCQHPVIIFRNVKYEDLVALISFMYRGEVNVEQEGLSSFLNTAELLEVKGLTGGSNKTFEGDDDSEESRRHSSPKPDSPVTKKRKTQHLEGGSQKDCIPVVKSEVDYSQEETEDTDSSQGLSHTVKTERHYEPTYDEDNVENSLDPAGVTAGISANENNIQDSLQERRFSSLVVYTCTDCGKSFKHSGSLSMHKRLHFGDTYCNYCGRNFSRKYYLKLHMKMHHNQQQRSLHMMKNDSSNLHLVKSEPQLQLNAII